MLNRVEISEDQLNEKSKALYLGLAIARESSTVINVLTEIHRQAEE